MVFAGVVLVVLGVIVLVATQVCLHLWLKKYKANWEGNYEV